MCFHYSDTEGAGEEGLSSIETNETVRYVSIKDVQLLLFGGLYL